MKVPKGGITIAERLKAITEEKGALLKEMDNMLNKAEDAKRSLTTDEQRKYDELGAKVSGLNGAWDELNEEEKRQLRGAKPIGGGGYDSGDEQNREDSIQILKRAPVDKERPITDWYLRNHDVDQRMQKASVFNFLQALATNKPQDAATAHALEECRTTTGTGLINAFLSSQLWDAGLSKSRLAQAGMRTFNMESGTHKMAKITTYPTFEWKAALASTTERTAVFDNVTFEAKTLRGFLNVSGELLQDGQNTSQALKRVMTQAAANAIDTAGLTGGGGDAPTGILSYSALNTYSNGGAALTSFDPLLEVTKLILDDDGNVPTAAIMSPRHWKQFSALKEATTNAPLHRPFVMDGLSFLDTSKVSGASAVFLGGFENLYLGIRFGVDVAVSPVIASTFSYDYFLAFRGDFKPEREQDFGAITSIA